MTIKERQIRDALIVKYYLENHTLEETGKKFNLSSFTIFRIVKKYKNQQKEVLHENL